MQVETTRLLVREGRKEDIACIMQFRNSEFVLQYNCMDMVNEEYCTKEILNPYTWVIELKEMRLRLSDGAFFTYTSHYFTFY